MVNSKKKGNAWENKIAKQIREYFVSDKYDAKIAHNLVHRTPLSGGHVERGDLIIKPPIWRAFPWFVECRNRESWSWKNVWEKGEESLILKWFLEDAVEKCHPYDNDSSYPRRPLLLFTKNQQQTYFCAWLSSLRFVLNPVIENSLAEVFIPYMLVDNPMLPNSERPPYDMAVLGLFDPFLSVHSTKDVDKDIDEYLGVNDVFSNV
jgi:hypothetical protein